MSETIEPADEKPKTAEEVKAEAVEAEKKEQERKVPDDLAQYDKWSKLKRDVAKDEARERYCYLCDFFEPVGRNWNGLCRRYAPQAQPQNTQWPSVQQKDWCGEFKPQV